MTIKIDSEEFPTTVYIVSNDSMNMKDVIITDIIAELKIDLDRISLVFNADYF